MFLTNWLRSVRKAFHGQARQARQTRQLMRFRPSIENLEQRQLLSNVPLMPVLTAAPQAYTASASSNSGMQILMNPVQQATPATAAPRMAADVQQIPYMQQTGASGSIKGPINMTTSFKISLNKGDTIKASMANTYINNTDGTTNPGPIGFLYVDLKDPTGKDLQSNDDCYYKWISVPAPGTYTFIVDGNDWSWAGAVTIHFTLNLTMTGANVPVNPGNPPNSVQPAQLGAISGEVYQGNPHGGLAGVTLQLQGSGSLASVNQKTVTDKNGNYTFSNLAPGSYTVREMVLTGMVATSPASAAVTLTGSNSITGTDFVEAPIVVAPAAPTNLKDTVASPYQVNLCWSQVSGADGDQIWYREAGKNWQLYNTVAANVTQASVMNLKPNTKYDFAVQAFNKAGSNASFVSDTTAKGILAILDNGKIDIYGTGGTDYIAVEQFSAQMYVMNTPIFVNGRGQASIEAVGQIVISGFGANSQIHLDKGAQEIMAKTTIDCTQGDTTIFTGGGDTLVTGASAAVTWVEEKPGAKVQFADGGKFGGEFIADKWSPNGTVLSDIVQGAGGDCEFLASLGGAVLRGVDAYGLTLNEKITYIGNFNFRVWLYDSAGALSFQNVRFDGHLSTTDPQTPGGEFWTVLYERAFYQSQGSLIQGLMEEPAELRALVGQATKSLYLSFNSNQTIFVDLNNAIHSGRAVVCGTSGFGLRDDDLVTGHDYTVTAIQLDSKAQPVSVTLRNPWGHQKPGTIGGAEITVTWSNFCHDMSWLFIN